jgi:hypothetical protein
MQFQRNGQANNASADDEIVSHEISERGQEVSLPPSFSFSLSVVEMNLKAAMDRTPNGLSR